MARKGAARAQANPKLNGGTAPETSANTRQPMPASAPNVTQSPGVAENQPEPRQQLQSQPRKMDQEADVMLTSDEISARAYQIYENEGRSDGKDMEHWFRAETELRSERQKHKGNTDARPRSQRQQG